MVTDRIPTRRRLQLRNGLLLLALAAIAAPLAACGSDKDDAKSDVLSAKDLALVANKTTALGGVRLSIDQTVSVGSSVTLPMSGKGVFDTKTQRGEMTMTMDLSSLPDAPSGGSSEQRMIFDGLTLYMSGDALGAGLGGGKKWIKLDLAKAGKEAGIDLGALVQGGGQDPTQALQYLKAASGDVTRVGTESVRGVETTHYKATIDLRKVADTVPADRRADVRKAIDQVIKLSGTSKTPMEVWIGKDGVVRRLKQTIKTKAAGQAMTIVQSIDLYGFGTKVKIKLPPASETADLADLGLPGTIE